MSRILRAFDAVASRIAGASLPAATSRDPFAGMLPWELTSRKSLTVPRRDSVEIDTAYAAALLDFAGVCTWRESVDRSLVSRCRSVAHSLAADVRASAWGKHGNPDAFHDGFELDECAYQRSPGRVDLRNHKAMYEPPFSDDALCSDAPWMPLVRHVLGDEAHLLWKGLVVAEPGTPEQSFHADGPIVNREVWASREAAAVAGSVRASLPAHSLTLHVPLVDYGPNGVGSTSFLPGSHQQLMASALQAEASEAGCSAGAGMPAALDAGAGDAIVFDLRTHHAGGANASSDRRSVLYLVYARPWYDGDLHRQLVEEGPLEGVMRR